MTYQSNTTIAARSGLMPTTKHRCRGIGVGTRRTTMPTPGLPNASDSLNKYAINHSNIDRTDHPTATTTLVLSGTIPGPFRFQREGTDPASRGPSTPADGADPEAAG